MILIEKAKVIVEKHSDFKASKGWLDVQMEEKTQYQVVKSVQWVWWFQRWKCWLPGGMPLPHFWRLQCMWHLELGRHWGALTKGCQNDPDSEMVEGNASRVVLLHSWSMHVDRVEPNQSLFGVLISQGALREWTKANFQFSITGRARHGWLVRFLAMCWMH